MILQFNTFYLFYNLIFVWIIGFVYFYYWKMREFEYSYENTFMAALWGIFWMIFLPFSLVGSDDFEVSH